MDWGALDDERVLHPPPELLDDDPLEELALLGGYGV
jgi:hypothetical protein